MNSIVWRIIKCKQVLDNRYVIVYAFFTKSIKKVHMKYSKLFKYLSESEVWKQPYHVRIIWITLVGLANKNSNIQITSRALADHAGTSLTDCYEAIEFLEENQTIVKNKKGWFVLGDLPELKLLAKQDERRDYQKLKMREYRGCDEEKDVIKHPATTKKKPLPDTHKTWIAYKEAYHNRYGVDPVHNARTNSQMKQFVDRIGIEESPFVAQYYLTSNNHYYTSRGHSVGILLADAEKLRTEFVTQQQISSTQAIAGDRRMATQNAFSRLLNEIKE